MHKQQSETVILNVNAVHNFCHVR